MQNEESISISESSSDNGMMDEAVANLKVADKKHRITRSFRLTYFQKIRAVYHEIEIFRGRWEL
jgi:hypothetical protein